MKIGVEVGDIARWEDEVIVVNLFEGIRRPGGATGAVKVALGRHACAMFVNDGPLREKLLHASEATAERLWEMPLWDEYDEQIKSDSADVQNTDGRSGGSITAAKFLQKFAEVCGGPISTSQAPPGWRRRPTRPRRNTSSGFGVRLLVRLLRDWKSNG